MSEPGSLLSMSFSIVPYSWSRFQRESRVEGDSVAIGESYEFADFWVVVGIAIYATSPPS